MPNEVRKATLDQYIKKKFKSEVQRFFRLPFLLGALVNISITFEVYYAYISILEMVVNRWPVLSKVLLKKHIPKPTIFH